MNKKQKIILLIGLAIFIAMCLIPPWYYKLEYPQRPAYSQPGGYFPIFIPPYPKDPARGGLFSDLINDKAAKTERKYVTVRIDKDRLYLQLLAVTVLTGGLVVLTMPRKICPK